MTSCIESRGAWVGLSGLVRIWAQLWQPIAAGWPGFPSGSVPCLGRQASGVAVSVIGFNGHVLDALLTSIYRALRMHILTLRIVSRHPPEAGAVCGSSARTDLCGG